MRSYPRIAAHSNVRAIDIKRSHEVRFADTRELTRAGQQLHFTFLPALAVVYLVLAAQWSVATERRSASPARLRAVNSA